MRSWKLLSLTGVLALAAAAPPAHSQAGVTVEIAIGKSVAMNVPADTGSAFPADVGVLYCWTRVTGAAGAKVTHVWIHGADSTSVDLNIGGSPWRTHSSRKIAATATGEWTVQVKDASGAVVGSKTFTIGG